MDWQISLLVFGLGGVMSLLLSIIAYFLKLLVQDIRDLKKDYGDLRALCIGLKAKQTELELKISKS
ncbi:hypothetical protein [Mongoliitalea daihaiensis]|uniref:hypothetical protein n=1 Tax=Mongoliitalea daihaiensis TaxID=2782006 RepID=UPI001F26E549|nr:hypothetical protein [Mongoliitalea daihaiensis]UJP64874.1 hypothetical protein IPZ59_19115 [Mongoliitalea daihaiensis]